uniref:Uncharacterized protein n=1 Tax=Kalanchoe fedtschenkoi TaxID=63787 RepID=A0A7N0U6U5_KALFE
MAREKKSPGLKILWAWTLGTAAILIASGVRSSMREMEAMMQSDEKQKQLADRLNDSVVIDDAGFQSEGFVKDDSSL